MAVLASRTSGAATGQPVGTPGWQTSNAITVDTTGDVTTVEVRLTGITSIGTGSFDVRLVRDSGVISTGSIAHSIVPDIPTGLPDGIYYAVTMTAVRINTAELITVEVQETTTTGSLAFWWHGPDSDREHVRINGTAFVFTPPVPTAKNVMTTNRRLVAAANNKFWYEGI